MFAERHVFSPSTAYSDRLRWPRRPLGQGVWSFANEDSFEGGRY